MKLKVAATMPTDILIIGGGAAGLRAAIEARKYGLDVTIVSESKVGFRNNTAIAAGGFAAEGIWKGDGDSPEVHLRDTMKAGRFINDRRLVETMTRNIRQQVCDLMKFGCNFRKADGELIVRQGAGHTYPRSVAVEAHKGINLSRPLRQHAAGIGVSFIEGVLVTRLLRSDHRVVGALGLDKNGQVVIISARSIILAAGGAGQLYLRSSNALGISGDGYALAYGAGATLRDMEFVQFYPTTWGKQVSRLCSYERYIPVGATLRNSRGEDILKVRGIDNINSVTRDKLTRIIMEEIIKGGGGEGKVVFDFTTINKENTEELYRSGLMHKGSFPEKLRVAPSAHFFMGGIKVNEDGEIGITGLYAAGETCGGMHGANRLMGNAISETLVFGTVTGKMAAGKALKIDREIPPSREVTAGVEMLTELASGSVGVNLEQLQKSLKQLMWDKVGIIRSQSSLEDARKDIVALREQLQTASSTDCRQLFHKLKLTNMSVVAEMVCRAALMRTESRGSHYRPDYPEENDGDWLKTIEISVQEQGMRLTAVPVSQPG